MGGLMILVGTISAILLWADLRNVYVALALAVTAGLGALGVADDLLKLRYKRTRQGPRGLDKKRKLIFQTLLGLLVGFVVWRQLGHTPFGHRLYIPFAAEQGLDLGVWIIPWTAVVIAAASNSVNISDGLDGLAGGCAVMIAPALGILVVFAGQPALSERFRVPHVPGCAEMLVVLAAMAGAVVGFLWYNCHPAQIFMGDTGSLALGGLIGFFALAAKQEVLLLLIGFVFVADMASVVLQVLSFKTTGKRIFKIAPYHHALQYRGWHENKITVRLWMLAAFAAALGLATLTLR